MSRPKIYPSGDGITKISDPFWQNTCRNCGHVFWSVLCTANCIKCGHPELSRKLGEIPYEQIIAERGKPIKSE